MSFENQVREFIRREVAAEVAPLRAAIAQLQGDAAQLAVLQQLAERLGPVLGLQPAAPAPRRRGRPARAAVAAASAPAAAAASAGRRRRGPPAVNDRPCAIIGCKRPSRTKGYCAAHYQKLRMLARTNRLPAGWKDFAEANSVEDVVLPRGRAASKALKESRAARTARAPRKAGRKGGRPKKDAAKAEAKESASEQKEG
jgi:hypothetical protein